MSDLFPPPDSLAARLLAFWFGEPGTSEWNHTRREWFTKSAAFDDRVRAGFLGAWQTEHTDGEVGTLWDLPVAERVGPPAVALLQCARIVLLDQVPRNVFRGDARSFATDARALAQAEAMLEAGHDRLLPTPHHRIFCYMPFEHAESIAAQDTAVRLMTAVRDETRGRVDVVEWAEKHRQVIARFGRFPHRNAVLGRASTDEETAFLHEPGSSF